MQSYPIHELERLTGVKAHTIRIWEKRYGLVEPDRTVTNRRIYNGDQVRKLLNVVTLLSKGYKISKIAELSETQLHEEIQTDKTRWQGETIYVGYINDLVKAMISFDEAGFEQIFSTASTRFGVYEAMIKVVYPFLSKIGVLWTVDKADPMQEHFATSVIKRKLMVAIDGLEQGTTIVNKKFLLFLPEGELHEIGLLFANYIIRSKGYETLYLGQNVPDSHLEEFVKLLKPDYMLLFYIASRTKEQVNAHIAELSKMSQHTQVLVTGNFELFDTEGKKLPNVRFLKGAQELLEIIE